MSGISTVTKIRYNPRGTYASNVRYGVDDMVFYLGSYYRCVVEGTTGVEPTIYDTDNSPWQKLSQTPYYEGEWSSSTTYFAGDVVGVTTTLPYNRVYNYQENDIYICTNNSGISGRSNYPPEDSADWKLLSKGNFNKKLAYLGGVNEGYVPTHKALWDARCGARPGGVGIVSLTSGGSGYTTTRGYPAGLSTAVVTISNGGGGTGFGASAVAYVGANGAISRIEITNPGFGYTSRPLVTISGGGGSSATATAFAYQTKIGVGDTVGTFKGPGHEGGGYSLGYINKQYGFVRAGYNDPSSGYHAGFSGNDSDDPVYCETPFVHLDWLEGLLPTPDGEPPKAIQVEYNGHYQAMILFNNGEIHYAGYNGHGQSGDATTTLNTQFVRCGYANTNKSGTSVLRGKKAIRIAATTGSDNSDAASAMYALIENADGTRELWAWGYNGYGQLANGNTTNQSRPVEISLPEATHGKIIEIWATGSQYGNLFVLTDTGRLFSAGYNGYGQLGVGDAVSKSVLTRVGIASTSFTWTEPGAGIKKFTCGQGGSANVFWILCTNGTLWNWGYNVNNSLGHNHTANVHRPIQVNTGGYTGNPSPVRYGVSVGTTVGLGFTDVYDVWTQGYRSSDGGAFISVGSTINPGVTTALACGYNGTYQLCVNDTTRRNVFVGMQTSSGLVTRNVVDVSTVVNDGNIYAYGALKTLQGPKNSEHYIFPYTNARLGFYDQSNSYNINPYQDPNFTSSNYRLKEIPQIPKGLDLNYIRIVTMEASGYQYGGSHLIDLKTGNVYLCWNTTSHGMHGYTNTGFRNIWQRLPNH
jgi:hypothetical protein